MSSFYQFNSIAVWFWFAVRILKTSSYIISRVGSKDILIQSFLDTRVCVLNLNRVLAGCIIQYDSGNKRFTQSLLLNFPGMNDFRKIFTSMLAQSTSSHRLLFQMCLPAETTVLMFGGYEQIPSHILWYELCFWK